MKSKNVKSYEKMLPETRTMLQVGPWAWCLLLAALESSLFQHDTLANDQVAKASQFARSATQHAATYMCICLMQDFYRPFNQRLSRMLGGDDRWLWGY